MKQFVIVAFGVLFSAMLAAQSVTRNEPKYFDAGELKAKEAALLNEGKTAPRPTARVVDFSVASTRHRSPVTND